MSILLETPEQYYSIMNRFIKDSEETIITTFGVFCGITYNSDISYKFPSEDRNFLDNISDKSNISIIVGVGGYTPNKKECNECGVAYARRTIRIEKHRELYPNINWYLCESLHSKVAVFKINGNYVAIIGSRNFTGSNNLEIAVPIFDSQTAKSLYDYANKIKSLSKQVNIDNVINSVVSNSDSKYLEFL